MTTIDEVARDTKPPLLLVLVLNPILRVVLRTPLGRAIRPFALLEFTGRRSGRTYRVPVGWHSLGTGSAVFTPAPWRANFAGGIHVNVHHCGRRRSLTGTLEADLAHVATAMQSLADQRRGSLRSIGVTIPTGHRVTEADVRAVDRAVITFAEP
ncbi:MAG: grhN [Actinomycetota bacterium]|nr:grhN [Actinomycetota bacterium]